MSERLKREIQDCPECSLYESDGPVTADLLCDEHRQEVKDQPHTARNFGDAYIEARNTVGNSAQQREQDEVIGVLGVLVGGSVGGLAAVYFSRYFAGWPAQVAAGGFIWVLLSVVFTAVSIRLLDGVIGDEQ